MLDADLQRSAAQRVGALSQVQLQSEVLDWSLYSNRRKIACFWGWSQRIGMWLIAFPSNSIESLCQYRDRMASDSLAIDCNASKFSVLDACELTADPDGRGTRRPGARR
jgi:hypothetical protein